MSVYRSRDDFKIGPSIHEKTDSTENVKNIINAAKCIKKDIEKIRIKIKENFKENIDLKLEEVDNYLTLVLSIFENFIARKNNDIK